MTGRPTPGRERFVLVLVVLLLGALLVLCSTQVFSTVTPADARAVRVTGQGVEPALAPLGLVLVALAAALTIAGRAARVVLGLGLVLLGAVVVLLSLPNGLDPEAGTRGAVTAATGVAGPVSAVAVGTPWPLAAAVAGLLTAAAGGVVLARSPRWSSGGGRYRQARPAEGSVPDPVDEWDALTAGADPTGADGPGPGPGTTP